MAKTASSTSASEPRYFVPIAESSFQRQVVAALKLCGYELFYHTRYSVGSGPGFPDVIAVRIVPARVIAVEVKGRSQQGKVGKATPAQEQWLAALDAAGVSARLWTPDSNFEEMLAWARE